MQIPFQEVSVRTVLAPCQLAIQLGACPVLSCALVLRFERLEDASLYIPILIGPHTLTLDQG